MLCSRVAQWKRAGPITQRSVDRNYALLTCFGASIGNYETYCTNAISLPTQWGSIHIHCALVFCGKTFVSTLLFSMKHGNCLSPERRQNFEKSSPWVGYHNPKVTFVYLSGFFGACVNFLISYLKCSISMLVHILVSIGFHLQAWRVSCSTHRLVTMVTCQ